MDSVARVEAEQRAETAQPGTGVGRGRGAESRRRIGNGGETVGAINRARTVKQLRAKPAQSTPAALLETNKPGRVGLIRTAVGPNRTR